jgi:hypothetical protein
LNYRFFVHLFRSLWIKPSSFFQRSLHVLAGESVRVEMKRCCDLDANRRCVWYEWGAVVGETPEVAAAKTVGRMCNARGSHMSMPIDSNVYVCVYQFSSVAFN